jgi:AbrB family looped-hinge helix DNA binding protein
MAAMVKVTRKYQVTIPKRVREKADVKVGDRLLVSERGGLIIMRKVKEESLLEFAGFWDGYPENLEEFVEELRRMWSTWRIKASV